MFVLDEGVFEQLNQGNVALAKIINGLRALPDVEFWMTRQQYALWSNLEANARLAQDLRIRVPLQDEPYVTRHQYTPAVEAVQGRQQATVAALALEKNAILITLDKDFAARFQKSGGMTLQKMQDIGNTAQPFNYNTGRRLLDLPQLNIGATDGRIYPPNTTVPPQRELPVSMIPRPARTPAQLAGASGPPTAPRGFMRGAKIGLKVTVGAIAVSGIGLLLSWLLGSTIQALQEAELERQVKNIEPKIQADFRKYKEAAVRMLADGKQAYVTIHVKTESQKHHMGPGGGWVETQRAYKYLGMEVAEKPISAPGFDGTAFKQVGEDYGGKMITPGATTGPSYYYKRSFPVNIDPDQLEFYRYYLKKIEWNTRISKYMPLRAVDDSRPEWMVKQAQEQKYAGIAYAWYLELQKALEE